GHVDARRLRDGRGAVRTAAGVHQRGPSRRPGSVSVVGGRVVRPAALSRKRHDHLRARAGRRLRCRYARPRAVLSTHPAGRVGGPLTPAPGRRPVLVKAPIRVFLVANLPPPLGGMTTWTRAYLAGAA